MLDARSFGTDANYAVRIFDEIFVVAKRKSGALLVLRPTCALPGEFILGGLIRDRKRRRRACLCMQRYQADLRCRAFQAAPMDFVGNPLPDRAMVVGILDARHSLAASEHSAMNLRIKSAVASN